MNELIKITDQNGQKAVNARGLHEFLESKQEFSNWIKNRIDKYGLVENVDYVTFDNFIKREGTNLKSKTIEYALTVDAAKELSMVEGNEKGKQARRYFIACEKIAQSSNFQLPNFSNPSEAARAWAEQYDKAKDLEFKNQQIEKENAENRPKVEFATSIMHSNDCISIAEMAQILKQNKLAKMGQNKFFDWLRCSDYIISRGGRRNLPSQKSINLGIMRIAECVSDERNGVTINRKAVITPQGQAYFIDLFKKLSGKEYRLFSR